MFAKLTIGFSYEYYNKKFLSGFGRNNFCTS